MFLLLPKLTINKDNGVGFAICLRHYGISDRAYRTEFKSWAHLSQMHAFLHVTQPK